MADLVVAGVRPRVGCCSPPLPVSLLGSGTSRCRTWHSAPAKTPLGFSVGIVWRPSRDSRKWRGWGALSVYIDIYIYIYICRESKRERERDSVPLGVPKVDSTVVRVRILRVRIPRPSVWVAWAASPTSWWFANRTRHPDGKNGKKPSLWVTQLDGRYYVLLGDDGGYDNILLYYGSKGGGPRPHVFD